MSLVGASSRVVRRPLGPFVFLDHSGPAAISAYGMDVRPIPTSASPR